MDCPADGNASAARAGHRAHRANDHVAATDGSGRRTGWHDDIASGDDQAQRRVTDSQDRGHGRWQQSAERADPPSPDVDREHGLASPAERWLRGVVLPDRVVVRGAGAQDGRQRHRCGGRDGARAGGDLSPGRQPRRWRVHADPARRRRYPLPGLPRDGTSRDRREDVSGQERAPKRERGPRRRAGVRAGHGLGPDTALTRFGTWSWEQVVSVVIDLADRGCTG